MSQISDELQRQQSADVGAAIARLFRDVPVIDKETERKRFETDELEQKLAAFAKLRNESSY